MANSNGRGRAAIGAIVVVGALIAVLSIPVDGASLGARFFDSLRIAKPKTVSAAVPGAVVPGSSRQLQSAVLGIVAETSTVAKDEPDVPVPGADSAARAAGFPVRLLRGRTDPPTITVLGAHDVSARVNRDQLRTLLVQAGRPSTNVPASLNGETIRVTVPRGVRVQYGNCPLPAANTIQNQINGPPPPSTDNANCIVLTETPVAATTAPPLLDTAAVLEIALELTGMSPNQARDFRQLFDWRSAITMSPPRSVRSYEMVNVGPGRGMLIMTGGRRGPTYALAWVQGDMVYTLTGYGSSADAVPLATSAQ